MALNCGGVKTLKNPLDSKEIKPVNPKGNHPWIFIARTDVEAETLVLWPYDAKSRLIGKDLDAEEDRRQEEKGMTEDEIDISLSKLWEIVKDSEAWLAVVNGTAKSLKWLSEWTTATLVNTSLYMKELWITCTLPEPVKVIWITRHG